DDEDSEYWRMLDNQLYQLCRSFPDHDYVGPILVKVIAVDRLYSAWLYRRRVEYMDVAQGLQASNIDTLLDDLGNRLTLKNVKDVANAELVVAGFGNPKGARYHVFASKYLHFHRPYAFPILDGSAEKRMKSISKEIGLHLDDCHCETRYECFCRKILALRKALRTVTDRRFSLLDFDKLLYGKPILMK
ncbi:MAG: hypothetical protein KAW09_12865, partial [Thermoplasmata archaeon]|nr:hypothetical protein [Thermoplasmata archaeon]